jgi:Flp pilus assembly protein TadG
MIEEYPTVSRIVKNQRTEGGAVAVEFVLVIPALFMLLMGIIDFGRYYNASIVVTNAAREASRVLALGGNAGAAGSAATTAAGPVTVSTSGVATCPPSGVGNASVTVSSSFTFAPILIGLGNTSITRTAVMRCGG